MIQDFHLHSLYKTKSTTVRTFLNLAKEADRSSLKNYIFFHNAFYLLAHFHTAKFC